MTSNLRIRVLASVALVVSITNAMSAQSTPQQLTDELLQADRAYSAASMRTDFVSGISAMFTTNVIMPLPTGTFSYTSADAVKNLRATPGSAGARAEWTPIRAGVSADGQHGFTFGYQAVHHADSSITHARYMTYWVKDRGVWKAAAYKRRRVEKAATFVMMPAAIPARIVPPVRDAETLAKHYASVVAIENTFSLESQTMGLGAAFQKFGRADAVNMGPGSEASFIVGAEAIGRSVVGGSSLTQPSPVSWGADTAFVASSGDLGITFGVIRQNKPTTPNAPGFAFFTIWYRESPAAPWRYIAE